ncbi:MAG TPA: 30S ribosomal protein S21 [Candidatus Paceibacterota bacterium]
MQVRKKEGESPNALIYRFTKKIQQSGILKEAKKRRFHSRKVSRLKRRLSAIHRSDKRREYEKAKKMGLA